MEIEYLRWEIEGKVATVWLDRPPVNAVTQQMYQEIRYTFSNIQTLGDDVRCVVLTGEGKNFCAGNELEEFESMTPDTAEPRMENSREAFWSVRDCAVPVIAAVNGAALGTGVALISCCDLAIAADDARLGMPEIKVGLLGGPKLLSRLMPPAYVRWMFYTGEMVPATQFAKFGGVLRVVPQAQLLAEARSIAHSIAAHSPVALAVGKQALNEVEYTDLKSGYRVEQDLTIDLLGHPHAKEALRAYRAKTTPRFG